MMWPVVYSSDPDVHRARRVGELFPHPKFPYQGLGPAYRAMLLRDPHCRPPLMIILPGFNRFCIDAFPGGQPDASWTVSIEGPLVDGQGVNLTLTPSVNQQGGWHGYITGGLITPDVSGRLYDEDGAPLPA